MMRFCKIILLGSFLLVVPVCLSGQYTLTSLRNYIQQLPELSEKPDDWSNPQFASSYAPRGFVQIVQNLFSLSRTGMMSLDSFKGLLGSCTQILDKKRYDCEKKGNCKSISLPVKETTKCIVWGPLFSAFHSLLRTLEDLHTRGIIDDNFRINGDYYFVFLGDVIGRGPYSIETFIVVLLLLQANPERVIYLAGDQERSGYWRNFNTKHQLKAMRWYLDCADQMDSFFAKLYRNLNCVVETDKKNQLLLSYNGIDKLSECEPINQSDATCPPRQDTLAVVQADTPMYQIHTVKSLLAYGYDYGALVWSVFSSPTAVHQEYRDYYYDAYSQITFGKTLGASTICSRVRHIVKDDTFYFSPSYNLVSGIQDGTSVAEKDFYPIGSTLAMSGAAEVHGSFIQEGILSLIGSVNKQGGIDNKFLRPFLYDDAYQPLFARRNAQYLLKNYDVDILVAPTGSPTLAFYRNMMLKPDVAVLCPSTGAPLFYDKKYKGLVLSRAPYTVEFDRLTRYIAKRHGVRRFAFFYQDDAFGRPATEQAIKVLQEFGITEVLKIPYSRDQIIFDKAARQLLDYKPDVIGLVAIPKPAIEFLRKVKTHNLIGKVIFATSILNEDTFKRFMRNSGVSYTIPHFLPNPHAHDVELVRDYQKAMDKAGLPYDDFTLEGYLAMALLKHALERIDQPFTKEKVLKEIESWKDYTYKGLALNFNPETRQLLDLFWIETLRFS